MLTPAIDAHVHIWNRNRGETFIAEKQYPALTGRAFLPEDLVPVLAETGAASAVLVHGPASVAHALYCLELCRVHSFFRAAVGWVDLRDPAFASQLAEQSEDPNFRGVRFTPLLDLDPHAYLRSDAAASVCASLARGGHLVEILAPPDLFDAVHELACAQPDLTVVLAHFGLPDGRAASLPAWRQRIERLARRPNIHVKLSGLPLTGGNPVDTTMTRTHVEALLELFGPQRLLYASNWPVATALARPDHWKILLTSALRTLGTTESQQMAIFSGNAARLY